MRDKSISINTLIVICGLISCLLEMGIYYFTGSGWAMVAIAVVLSLGMSKLFLDMSLSHETLFYLALLNTLVQFVFTAVVFLLPDNSYIQFNSLLGVNTFVNWLVPVAYSIIYHMFDRGPRMHDFHEAFTNSSVLCMVLYGIILLERLFIQPMEAPYESLAFGANDFVPMMEWATRLEETLRAQASTAPILKYALTLIVMGMPAGFYLRLLLREIHVVARSILVLVLPVILFGCRQLVGRGIIDIDMCFLFLVGSLLGILSYHIIVLLFDVVANRKFMDARSKNSSRGLQF